MSENLPTVLPVNVNGAGSPAALTSAPQNQPVGAQNIFANLLVAQFKERGFALHGMGALKLDQVVAPMQELPQGGKVLPVALPVGDDLMQMLQAGHTAELLPATMVAADDAPIAGNVLDMALRAALRATAPVTTAAPVTLSADTGLPAPATGAHVRDHAAVAGNSLLAQLNDTVLLNQMTGNARQSGLPSIVSFDPLPDLLAQKLATQLNAAAPATSALGGQSSSQLFGQLAGAAPTLSSQVPAQSVFVPVDHANWGHEFGDRVRWLVTQNIQTADIRLNPPELGPVRVQISMDQAQVSVTFTSHHAVVRDALQSAMANLGSMLAESGLNLAHGNVADQSPRQHHADTDNPDDANTITGDDASGPDGPSNGEGRLRVMGGQGLIDQYV